MAAVDQQYPSTGGCVLVVTTSHSRLGDTGEQTGLWLSELTHPYFILHDSGVAVDIVSTERGPLVVDPRSESDDDPDNKRFLNDEGLQQRVHNLRKLGDVDWRDYQGIFFAGGHGAMWDFADNADVQEAVKHFSNAGQTIGAVCHGVAALANVQTPEGRYFIGGKRVTGFTNEEEAEVGLDAVVPFSLEDLLRERGAQFEARPAWHEYVVTDGQLVTGQNPMSGKFVGIAMVKNLQKTTSPE